MTYKEIKPLVIEWAREKNLTDSGKQYIKIFEEVGELAGAILKNDLPEIKDAIGDIAVTLIIHGWQTNTCYGRNYNDIYNGNNLDEDFGNLIYAINGGFKDTMIFVNTIAHKYDTTLDECLLLAWNVIKNRTGKTVNGTFIKDSK